MSHVLSCATALMALFLVATTGCASPSEASTERAPESVHLNGVLGEWSASIEAKGRTEEFATSGYMECRPLAELEGAHVCGSSSSYAMNTALVRASLYAEGDFGAERGSVVSTIDRAYRQGLSDAGGHDLQSAKLAAFWEAAGRACDEKGPSYCPTDSERALFTTYVLPLLAKGRPFVVIAFALDLADKARVSLGHELHHAQYFLVDAFRATTDKFWDEQVTAEDKSAVRTTLAPIYDVTDDLLVRNEFMAYLIDGQSLLASFAPTYRARLVDQLTANGAAPLQLP